jgi:hypothetical protein
MVDMAVETPVRNYRIRRRTDRRNLADLLLTTLSFIFIAASLLFCLWLRFEITRMGYEAQQLREEADSMQRAGAALVAEEQTLKHPERLEQFAREFGMAPMRIHQLLPPGVREIDTSAANSLAMAGVSRPDGAARRDALVR